MTDSEVASEVASGVAVTGEGDLSEDARGQQKEEGRREEGRGEEGRREEMEVSEKDDKAMHWLEGLTLDPSSSPSPNPNSACVGWKGGRRSS